MSDLPSRISVREVGPRDGLQNEQPVPTEAKIELIDRLSDTGVSRIEAVSFVRPEAIPQMADADAVWRGIERTPSVRYSALVPNLRGARRALDAGVTELEAAVLATAAPAAVATAAAVPGRASTPPARTARRLLRRAVRGRAAIALFAAGGDCRSS